MIQAVSIGYGKVTFDSSSVSLVCFAVEPTFARDFPAKKYPQRGRVQTFPASQYPDVNGTLMLNTLEVPDGAILCLQSSHRSNGISMRDGAVFLRVREQGPLLVINSNLPVNRASLLTSTHVMFQGRADLLSLDELADEGILPNKGWIEGFMEPDEISQCFDIEQLDSEKSAPPKVEVLTGMSGEKVALKTSQPTRRIRVR